MPVVTLEGKEKYSSKMSELKPKLSSHKLVEKMKDKGISLGNHSEEEVEQYLLKSNNFLRLCSYRKNYQKYECGQYQGQYKDLSFDQLKALAIFDMQLRKTILAICVDIEHSLKVRILSDFEKIDNDGYSLMQDYFNQQQNSSLCLNLIKKHKNVYLSKLVDKYIYPKEDDNVYYCICDDKEYNIDLPIWAALEMITFGELLYFYKYFYEERYGDFLQVPIDYNILSSVKSIRNACAHNNCILADLSIYNTHSIGKIRVFIGKLGISPTKKLKCQVLSEITCTLYSITKLGVTGIKKYDLQNLKNVIDNFAQNKLQLFQNNQTICTNIIFLKNLVDKLV